MVTIELEKCTDCGTCVRICHEHCMSVHAGKISIDYKSCSTCTQCVAVCPEQALAWNHTPPSVFDSPKLPAFDQMDEMLKQRRTVRHFGPERVSRSVLENLAQYGAYAPTHSHDFRMIIIDDTTIVDLMDKVLTRYTSKIYGLLFKPRIIYRIMKLFAPGMKDEYNRAKTKLEIGVKSGSILRSRPAAFMALVGSKHTPLNLESAQYAVYNLTLMAQSIGLGCRNLVGNQSILNRDREFRKEMNLGRADQIFGLVGIGHPSVKYKNKVEGRALPIQWNGVEEPRKRPIGAGRTNT